jgi:hypothetical protein
MHAALLFTANSRALFKSFERYEVNCRGLVRFFIPLAPYRRFTPQSLRTFDNPQNYRSRRFRYNSMI